MDILTEVLEASGNKKYTKPGIIRIRIRETGFGLELLPEGYGDYCGQEGFGVPIHLELCEGKLWLNVWADINQEEPTHRINMNGALESNRQEEN